MSISKSPVTVAIAPYSTAEEKLAALKPMPAQILNPGISVVTPSNRNWLDDLSAWVKGQGVDYYLDSIKNTSGAAPDDTLVQTDTAVAVTKAAWWQKIPKVVFIAAGVGVVVLLLARGRK